MMKFVCNRKSFDKALSTVEKAINSNSTLPVLNNILIKAEEGKILLAATNLEIAITCDIEANILNEGGITVPAKLVSGYVQLLNDEEIEVEVLEGLNLSLKTSNSSTKIKCIDAEEFPLIPDLEEGQRFSVDGGNLQKAIVNTVFAASLNTSRPILSGVHILSKGDGLRLVATDSYRLAEKKIEFKVGEEIACTVPARTMVELSKIIGKGEESMVEVTVGDNQILFVYDGVRLISRLIDGKYPDYEKIIPVDSKTSFEIDSASLINLVKRVSLFARENNNSVKVLVEKGKVVITSEETKVGEEKNEMSVDVSGEDNSISINAQYLLDVLNVIGQDAVRIMINDKMSPAVIRPKGDDAYVYIIMPLKI